VRLCEGKLGFYRCSMYRCSMKKLDPAEKKRRKYERLKEWRKAHPWLYKLQWERAYAKRKGGRRQDSSPGSTTQTEELIYEQPEELQGGDSALRGQLRKSAPIIRASRALAGSISQRTGEDRGPPGESAEESRVNKRLKELLERRRARERPGVEVTLQF
jgi:hypothetical protein